MMSNQFSVILRAFMTMAGAAGFVLGFGLAIWRETTLAWALFKGAVFCAVATLLVRMLVVMLFRAYLKQIQVRRLQEDEKEK